MLDPNYTSKSRYCFHINKYFVYTNDENIAGIYFDIRELLERDCRIRNEYALTVNDMLVKFNRFLNETNQQNSELGTKVQEKMRQAFTYLSTLENGVTLARKNILSCIEDIIVLSGGMPRLI